MTSLAESTDTGPGPRKGRTVAAGILALGAVGVAVVVLLRQPEGEYVNIRGVPRFQLPALDLVVQGGGATVSLVNRSTVAFPPAQASRTARVVWRVAGPDGKDPTARASHEVARFSATAPLAPRQTWRQELPVAGIPRPCTLEATLLLASDSAEQELVIAERRAELRNP